MAKYRKKVLVEAEVFTEGIEDGWFVSECDTENRSYGAFYLPNEEIKPEIHTKLVPCIKTLEGWLKISEGDYILTGEEGERWPCKPDIFEKTYEKVENAA